MAEGTAKGARRVHLLERAQDIQSTTSTKDGDLWDGLFLLKERGQLRHALRVRFLQLFHAVRPLRLAFLVSSTRDFLVPAFLCLDRIHVDCGKGHRLILEHLHVGIKGCETMGCQKDRCVVIVGVAYS